MSKVLKLTVVSHDMYRVVPTYQRQLLDVDVTYGTFIQSTPYFEFTSDRTQFRTREKEMSRIDSLLAQAEYIQKELEKETAKRLKYGEEPADGRVLTFEYQFTKGGTWYSYAAVRARGLWNTTGPKSPKAYTWDELIDWWERGKVRKLRIVTKAEKLV